MIFRLLAVAALASIIASPALSQKKYDPGASDSEIKLGQTLPYSGPVSVLSGVGKSQTAYFRSLNQTQGGINGRKLALVSLDDGYSPPKTIELTRQLVENDKVLAIVNTVGTATNRTIHRYLNQKKVPQLLILTGAAQWNDPKHFPWTMMGMIAYQTEGTRLRAPHPGRQAGRPHRGAASERRFRQGLRRRLPAWPWRQHQGHRG